MLYRRSTQVAVEVVLLLASEEERTTRRVRDLASELGIPSPYLAKIVQSLTRAGLLRALRGPRGGVRLHRSAHDIKLWDILSAVEPAGEFERCFLSLDRCDDLHPCPIHDDWAPIRTSILTMLRKKSMWQIASEARHSGALGWQQDKKATHPRPPSGSRKEKTVPRADSQRASTDGGTRS